MNPERIIGEFYRPGTLSHDILMEHAHLVTMKSLDIADQIPQLNPDKAFIEEAAMLHDIGIFMTNSPSIGCYGSSEYICHGILGRSLLEGLGFPRHALVSERHTGAGISIENIRQHNLPLPMREMVPITLEEKVICVADKFFSKKPSDNHREKSLDTVILELKRINPDHAGRFKGWLDELFPFI